jgi:hypothetical protein
MIRGSGRACLDEAALIQFGPRCAAAARRTWRVTPTVTVSAWMRIQLMISPVSAFFARAHLTIVAAFLPLMLAGCSGGSMSSELTMRPDPRPLGKSAGSVVRLPKDEKFAIALAPAQKSPGLQGTADATASAAREGNAELTASVENGGTAAATFQLGHAFANDSDRQIDLLVKTRFNCEFRAEVKPAGETEDATLGLSIFARDGHGRLLKSVGVVQYSTSEGSLSSRSGRENEFTLTLGPGQSVSVFVAGDVRIDAKEGRTVSGAMRLTGLEMDVESKPAPAVSATTKPAGS